MRIAGFRSEAGFCGFHQGFKGQACSGFLQAGPEDVIGVCRQAFLILLITAQEMVNLLAVLTVVIHSERVGDVAWFELVVFREGGKGTLIVSHCAPVAKVYQQSEPGVSGIDAQEFCFCICERFLKARPTLIL